MKPPFNIERRMAGDASLKELSSVLQAQVRRSNVLGRYCGEEFVILSPATTKEQTGLMAERLRGAVAAHEFGGSPVRPQLAPRLQPGRRGLPRGCPGHPVVRQCGGQAAYNAKQGGKNPVYLHGSTV